MAITQIQRPWVGRFAPTPSGPLHFGSLTAALGSYLIAKQNNGLWLMRIEDLDPPREMPGAAADILHTLESFGFEWDGQVLYQSQRYEAYRAALKRLDQKGLIYYCDCSRKMVIERNQGVYDQFCRKRGLSNDNGAARIKFNDHFTRFFDEILGDCQFDQPEHYQDFVVKRRDGFWAYQLAVVVDDIAQEINHVVRGADILDSTPRQNFLYSCYNKAAPKYYHLPLVVDAKGQKLSKSKLSPAIPKQQMTAWLVRAYAHLGQSLVDDIEMALPGEFLQWACQNFNLSQVGTSPQTFLPINK